MPLHTFSIFATYVLLVPVVARVTVIWGLVTALAARTPEPAAGEGAPVAAHA